MSPASSLPRNLRHAALISGVAAALIVPASAIAADPASSAVVLSTDNKISTFETAYPTEAATPTAVTDPTGAALTDKLVAIDFRPQNGALYALGFKYDAGTPANSTIQLYNLSLRTGVATKIGPAHTVAGASASTQFGFDVNPKADRVRVVSDSGLNLRLDPNSGAITTNTPITPGTVKVDGAAYTNNSQNATATSLYTLSGADDKIYLQTLPDDGAQTAGRALSAGGAAANISAVGGFDITAGVDVSADDAEVAAGASGYAAVKVGTVTLLTKVDLKTGNATPVGTIGAGSQDVQGLAIQQEVKAGGRPAVTLAGDGKLRRFDTAQPDVGTETTTITGLVNGDTAVAIDWRPQTGQLLLLGVNAATKSGTLYRLDPQTATATPLGAAGSVAFSTGTTAVDLQAGGYDIDVDPTSDSVRVATTTGLNFRIGVDGAPIDGNNGGSTAVTGTNPDGAQNGEATVGTDVAAIAFNESFGQKTTGGGTSLFGISAGKKRLQTWTPLNAGTQTAPRALTVDGTALDFTAVHGFDIQPPPTGPTPALAGAGTGLAALTAGSPASTGLYEITLPAGATTRKGTLPAAPVSFAVGDGPTPAKTRNPPVVLPPIVIPPITLPPNNPPNAVNPVGKSGFAKSTKVTFKLRSTKVSAAGPAKLQIKNSNRFPVKVRVSITTPKSGKRKAIKYATKTYTLQFSRTRTVNVRLPSAARKVLRTKKKLTLRVSSKATAPNGQVRTVNKTLTARRK